MSGDVFKRPLNYPGFFIVFEGPDGAGTTTQAAPLINWIKGANKYHDVLDTHEPWKSVAINEVLTQDSDPNAQKDLMTRLFTEMRQDHTVRLISPSLANGIIVLSDRYTMSTCAYQQAQGEGLPKIVGMHRARNILVPNITYLIDAPVDVCMARIGHREGDREKFEQQEFLEELGRIIWIWLKVLKEESVEGSLEML
jgi:dTMP kinase